MPKTTTCAHNSPKLSPTVPVRRLPFRRKLDKNAPKAIGYIHVSTKMSAPLCFSLAIAVLLISAGKTDAQSKKRANEECTQDSECKGHCYTRKSDSKKVCVDCSSSTIERTREKIDTWCHNTPKRCDQAQPPSEVSEATYKTSIEAFKTCIEWRNTENKECWDGADQGHRDAVSQNETGKRNCEDNLSNGKREGAIYTCSDSTYSSRNDDTERYCPRDQDKICDRWSKDNTKVDCRAIEEARDQARKCASAVDSLKSSCFDYLSRRREGQRDRAKKGDSLCDELLEYKRCNSLCS